MEQLKMNGKFKKLDLAKQFLLLTFIIFTILFAMAITIYTFKSNGELKACEYENTTAALETSKTEPMKNLLEPAEKTVDSVGDKITPTEISVKHDSLGEFRITAYCACDICCEEYAYNRPIDKNGKPIVYGASGEPLRQGVSVAADTSILPFGTEILIDGHKYVVQDIGGAIQGNRIDIYYENHSDALAFGIKYSTVIKI